MKGMIKRSFQVILSIAMIFAMTSCDPVETPAVTFAFKNVDSAADYNESLTSFEVGKRFYTCISVKLVTDKKKPHDYQAVVRVPKTNEVEVKEMGGLDPDSIDWDEKKNETVLTYTIQGYKEATPEKLLFYGTPTDEGEAKISIKIFDEDGNKVNSWNRKVFFVYDLQE